MAALPWGNFDYTSAEIEVSKIRGSGCDIRGSWFVSFQDSGFGFGRQDLWFVLRVTVHDSRVTIHELRVSSHENA